eukprot:SAG31_NODE_294_length_18242_cov_28.418949_20_plen_103_part_00
MLEDEDEATVETIKVKLDSYPEWAEYRDMRHDLFVPQGAEVWTAVILLLLLRLASFLTDVVCRFCCWSLVLQQRHCSWKVPDSASGTVSHQTSSHVKHEYIN